MSGLQRWFRAIREKLPEAEGGLTPAQAMLLAWFAAACINTVLLKVIGLQSFKNSGFMSSAQIHVYDMGQSLMLGAFIAMVVLFFQGRSHRARVWGWGVAVATSMGLGLLILSDDLQGPVDRFTGGDESSLPLILVSMTMAVSVPVSAWLTRWFARGKIRFLPLGVALVAMVQNHLILRGDYAGAHLLLGTWAACVAGVAVIGVRIKLPRVLWWTLTIMTAVLVLRVLALPPAAKTTPALAHSWARGINAILPRTIWRHFQESLTEDQAPEEYGEAVPPTLSDKFPKNPIIIYYSVDSLRADLLDTRYEKRFPNIHGLKKDSFNFSQARSPSSRTTMTLTTVMTGKYSAQLYWTSKYVPEGKGTRAIYAHKDPAVHFPEILSEAEIPTVQYGQAVWLRNEYRMTAGFSESEIVAPIPGKPSTKGKWSTGEDVIKKIFERLEKASDDPRPMFLFFHDLDPHSPFDLGSLKKGHYKRRYLSEVQLTDSRIGRLRKLLEETGLADRTILILTGDHGEGFGEHGTRFHGQNLYDEQIRVPLLIHIPGLEAKTIDEYVSLIDLGPTILDLMGQTTPAAFLGQSLVPYFLGDRPDFTRPLIFEVRSKEALILPNGLKVIRDRKSGSKEFYDLKSDPQESENIFDDRSSEATDALNQLDDFFKRYELRKKGYKNRMKR